MRLIMNLNMTAAGVIQKTLEIGCTVLENKKGLQQVNRSALHLHLSAKVRIGHSAWHTYSDAVRDGDATVTMPLRWTLREIPSIELSLG